MNGPKSIQDGKHRSLPPEYAPHCRAGYSYPPFPIAEIASVCLLTNHLLANEWRDPGEIRADQLAQLRLLLQFAREQCPLYGERMQAVGLDPQTMTGLEEFRRLPLLTRRDLQDDFDRVRARKLPPSTRTVGELKTSGSIGAPVLLLGTNITVLLWIALSVRDHVWAGIDPTGSLVSIRHFDKESRKDWGGYSLHTQGWGGALGRCFVTGPAHLMEIGADYEDQLAFTVEADADYVISYPSSLEILAKMLVERGLELPGLKLVQTISEAMPDDVRRNIESAFNAPVWDLYSCVEVGYVASQCPGGHGYHVHDESVLVEILDEDDQPCQPGEPGKVVVTALTNYTTPVIRYDVGDYARQTSGPCPCGRGLTRLAEIIGRKRGQLMLPDGRVKFSSPLTVVMRTVGGVRQFRAVQHTREHMEVIIVPLEDFCDEHKRIITKEFQSYMGTPIQVSFTLVDHIERTPGGKYLDFICNAT